MSPKQPEAGTATSVPCLCIGDPLFVVGGLPEYRQQVAGLWPNPAGALVELGGHEGAGVGEFGSGHTAGIGIGAGRTK